MVVRTLTALAISLLAFGASAAPTETQLSEQDKVSYALGVAQARSLQRNSITVNPEIYGQGFRDALAGAKPRLTDEEMRVIGSSLQKQLAQQQRTNTHEKEEQLEAKNGELGQAFLATNKGRPDVVTLDSGLQYKVIKAGSGQLPSLDDTVSLNYRGRLINGKEFANTFKGKPVTFPVKKFIPGWREALQRMPVGSKWELYVPPELAYGEKKAGRKIPPNSTLVFEVELLSIAKSSVAQPDQRAAAKQVAERTR
jgi:FKBP-type peptidyl-prolyl cis-trans isomerase FklB